MEVIQNRDHWVLHRLEGFYSNEENFKKIETILSGNSKGKVAQPSTNITTTGRATFLSSLGFTQHINSLFTNYLLHFR